MAKRKPKYIFVFGGVLSGLGKGIVASSLGYLLKSTGYKITIQKLDPYLNVDPGTMNPCLLYTSPSPRDRTRSRMPSSA